MQTLLINQLIPYLPGSLPEKYKTVNVLIKGLSFTNCSLDGVVTVEVHLNDKYVAVFNEVPILLESLASELFITPSFEWVIRVPYVKDPIQIGLIIAGFYEENGVNYDEQLYVNPSLQHVGFRELLPFSMQSNYDDNYEI